MNKSTQVSAIMTKKVITLSKGDSLEKAELLFKTKKNKTLENLKLAGIISIYDLLWVLPLHIEKIPPLNDFSHITEGGYFRGFASIRDVQQRINPKLKGKGSAPLMNLTVHIKDFYSDRFLALKWFNTYPSTIKKIQQSEYILFFGKTNKICIIVYIYF